MWLSQGTNETLKIHLRKAVRKNDGTLSNITDGHCLQQKINFTVQHKKSLHFKGLSND